MSQDLDSAASSTGTSTSAKGKTGPKASPAAVWTDCFLKTGLAKSGRTIRPYNQVICILHVQHHYMWQYNANELSLCDVHHIHR